MRQKLVHVRAPLGFLFLIRKLQDLKNSSCLKVFEILLFSDRYARFSVAKTLKFKIFDKR